ncbi:MAG TPA: hypothetical protein VFF52_22185 [Isosphaeraceae bacterium]|nr:hypothetical protein [Isosphaeraceae bacterium]
MSRHPGASLGLGPHGWKNLQPPGNVTNIPQPYHQACLPLLPTANNTNTTILANAGSSANGSMWFWGQGDQCESSHIRTPNTWCCEYDWSMGPGIELSTPVAHGAARVRPRGAPIRYQPSIA